MSIINANGKLYAKCFDCDKLVRINKPIFGAMHFCLTPQEREIKQHHAYLMQQQLNFKPMSMMFELLYKDTNSNMNDIDTK